MQKFVKSILFLLLGAILLTGCTTVKAPNESNKTPSTTLESIPEFTNEPYVVIFPQRRIKYNLKVHKKPINRDTKPIIV